MWVWVNSGSWWWTGRPGVLRFMGSQRVGHDWATELTELNRRQVTPVFLPRKFHGQRSLVGYIQGIKIVKHDLVTKHTHTHTHTHTRQLSRSLGSLSYLKRILHLLKSHNSFSIFVFIFKACSSCMNWFILTLDFWYWDASWLLIISAQSSNAYIQSWILK